MEDLIFSNKLTAAVKTAIVNISERLKINPNWLIAVMYKESSLNPKSVNKYSGATGLIQFMPNTAISLGTTVDKLKNMTFEQQLVFVEKYYKPFTGKLKNYNDLYLATLFPVAVGKPDNYVLQTSKISAGTIANQNPSLDANKDAKITVGEVKTWFENNIPKDALTVLKNTLKIGAPFVMLFVIAFGFWMFYGKGAQ